MAKPDITPSSAEATESNIVVGMLSNSSLDANTTATMSQPSLMLYEGRNVSNKQADK